jgi:hypothetical protein
MTQAEKYRLLASELRQQADRSRTMRDTILAVARHFEACAAAMDIVVQNPARTKKFRLVA